MCSSPSQYLCLGLSCPKYSLYFALYFLHFLRFFWTSFLSLSRSPWVASHPSGVPVALFSPMSSAKLLGVHSISLSTSLMKILKSTSPKTDFSPASRWALTTTLWQILTIYDISCSLNSPPFKSISLQLEIRMLCGTVLKLSQGICIIIRQTQKNGFLFVSS